MKIVQLLLLIAFVICPIILKAETNHWGRIEELAKQGTPQGNPQLEMYLRSLTPAQMLEAARQYCKQGEKTLSEEHWAEASFNVALVLSLYGNDKGGLADDRLDALLKCVADKNEGLFFRESLMRILPKYWPHLTESQRKKCRQTFLSVLVDKKNPVRIRTMTCRELELAIAFDYRQTIYADKNVRPLRQDKEKSKNLNGLVRSGEVRLDPETRKSLKTVRDEIETITPTLSALSNDINESPEVKDRAQKALKSLGELPDVSEK